VSTVSASAVEEGVKVLEGAGVMMLAPVFELALVVLTEEAVLEEERVVLLDGLPPVDVVLTAEEVGTMLLMDVLDTLVDPGVLVTAPLLNTAALDIASLLSVKV